MILKVAEKAHEGLRRISRGKPHIRITKDDKWIKQHGTNQINTAMVDYSLLPSDWQTERTVGSQIALDAIFDAIEKDRPLDDDFIENTSNLLHAKWLERNSKRATDEQQSSYDALSEVEKEKDRVFVRSAIEVYQSTQ